MDSTTMTAADNDETSVSWVVSDTLSRACGSVFASTLIAALSSSSSALITSDSNAIFQDLGDLRESLLQPEEPNEQQTETYNAFCRAIRDICDNRIYRQSESQTFPYAGPADVKAIKDPYPNNPTFLESATSSLTGDVSDLVQEMTASIYNKSTKNMARIFGQTCLGEWYGNPYPGFVNLIRHCAEGTGHNDKEEWQGWDGAATIRYRWELALLTDYVVGLFELPMPGKEICILWHKFEWRKNMSKSRPDWDTLHSKVWQALCSSYILAPSDVQGPRFSRPLSYLCAAITEADKPWDETKDLMDRILRFMATAKKIQHDHACQDVEVLSRGREWLKSVGRGIRRSLSPQKRDSLRLL